MAENEGNDGSAPAQSPVTFGSDEWGVWAKALTERVGALESASKNVTLDASEVFAGINTRLDAVEAALKAKQSKAKSGDGVVVDETDVGARLAALEVALGVGRVDVPAEDAVSEKLVAPKSDGPVFAADADPKVIKAVKDADAEVFRQ